MISDERADAGFAEAMVALMAVTVVLSAFLVAVAHTSVDSTDHVAALDMERFGGRIEDGEFMPSFTGYMGDFLDSTGASGISVSVTVPGGFCRPMEPIVLGSMDGPLDSLSAVVNVPDDHGRTVPALVEVTVCG